MRLALAVTLCRPLSPCLRRLLSLLHYSQTVSLPLCFFPRYPITHSLPTWAQPRLPWTPSEDVCITSPLALAGNQSRLNLVWSGRWRPLCRWSGLPSLAWPGSVPSPQSPAQQTLVSRYLVCHLHFPSRLLFSNSTLSHTLAVYLCTRHSSRQCISPFIYPIYLVSLHYSPLPITPRRHPRWS